MIRKAPPDGEKAPTIDWCWWRAGIELGGLGANGEKLRFERISGRSGACRVFAVPGRNGEIVVQDQLRAPCLVRPEETLDLPQEFKGLPARDLIGVAKNRQLVVANADDEPPPLVAVYSGQGNRAFAIDE